MQQNYAFRCEELIIDKNGNLVPHDNMKDLKPPFFTNKIADALLVNLPYPNNDPSNGKPRIFCFTNQEDKKKTLVYKGRYWIPENSDLEKLKFEFTKGSLELSKWRINELLKPFMKNKMPDRWIINTIDSNSKEDLNKAYLTKIDYPEDISNEPALLIFKDKDNKYSLSEDFHSKANAIKKIDKENIVGAIYGLSISAIFDQIAYKALVNNKFDTKKNASEPITTPIIPIISSPSPKQTFFKPEDNTQKIVPPIIPPPIFNLQELIDNLKKLSLLTVYGKIILATKINVLSDISPDISQDNILFLVESHRKEFDILKNSNLVRDESKIDFQKIYDLYDNALKPNQKLISEKPVAACSHFKK